jgi:hypothetical protein
MSSARGSKGSHRRRAESPVEYEHLVYDLLVEKAIENGTAVPRLSPCTPECAVCNTTPEENRS